jgi:hypothetical protein
MRCSENNDLEMLVHVLEKGDEVRPYSDTGFDVEPVRDLYAEVKIGLLLEVLVAVHHGLI